MVYENSVVRKSYIYVNVVLLSKAIWPLGNIAF